MRSLRTLIGLVLVVGGVPMVGAATAGWNAMQHRDPSGGFSAALAPLRSDGYAVIVPDVATLTDRHGLARVLGSGQMRITVRSSAAPIEMIVAPAADVSRYLDGVARSEVTGVGFADGVQPIEITEIAGARVPSPDAKFWVTTGPQSVELDLPTAGQESLVLMRADGAPGLDVSLAVGLYPSWINTATWGLLLAGSVAVLAGIVVLFWPTPRREMVLVLEPHRMIDFADRMAHKLNGTQRLRVRRSRGQTGEPISDEPAGAAPWTDTEPMRGDPMEKKRWWRWRKLDADDLGDAEFDGSATDEAFESMEWDDPTRARRGDHDGESPYIYTAT